MTSLPGYCICLAALWCIKNCHIHLYSLIFCLFELSVFLLFRLWPEIRSVNSTQRNRSKHISTESETLKPSKMQSRWFQTNWIESNWFRKKGKRETRRVWSPSLFAGQDDSATDSGVRQWKLRGELGDINTGFSAPAWLHQQQLFPIATDITYTLEWEFVMKGHLGDF